MLYYAAPFFVICRMPEYLWVKTVKGAGYRDVAETLIYSKRKDKSMTYETFKQELLGELHRQKGK